MPNKAKYYIGSIIVAGAVLLLASLPGMAPASYPVLLICIGLAALLSPLKLRLPGMEGTYAPTFIPILYGIAHLSLPETLLIGLTVALAGSYINTQKKPAPVQVAFNGGNLALSIGICFLIAGLLRQSGGLSAAVPAVAVLLAGLYFVVNTGLVSGVLSLLQGKTLAEVSASWYVWTLPYYLTGAAAVTVSSPGAGGVRWEGAIVVLAMLSLLHFYCGLAERTQRESLTGEDQPEMPGSARLFLTVVSIAAAGVAAMGLISAGPIDPGRLAAVLVLSGILSALKVRLPGLEGSVSLGFVVLLSAVIELSLMEVCLVAAVGALVQCLWAPAHRPKLVQVAFSAASFVLAGALAFATVRHWATASIGDSLMGQLGAAAAILYLANTLLVSTMLCLVEREPLTTIWRRSHFWVFPYYLVGAAGAAILVSTSRVYGWMPSLLVLPTMVLVYVSYRIQVGQQLASSK
jgi:hypothetical protein